MANMPTVAEVDNWNHSEIHPILMQDFFNLPDSEKIKYLITFRCIYNFSREDTANILGCSVDELDAQFVELGIDVNNYVYVTHYERRATDFFTKDSLTAMDKVDHKKRNRALMELFRRKTIPDLAKQLNYSDRHLRQLRSEVSEEEGIAITSPKDPVRIPKSERQEPKELSKESAPMEVQKELLPKEPMAEIRKELPSKEQPPKKISVPEKPKEISRETPKEPPKEEPKENLEKIPKEPSSEESKEAPRKVVLYRPEMANKLSPEEASSKLIIDSATNFIRLCAEMKIPINAISIETDGKYPSFYMGKDEDSPPK